ncbi:MAG: hypothetical protein RIF46_01375 [Cyclobacteriaceae bacterium]
MKSMQPQEWAQYALSDEVDFNQVKLIDEVEFKVFLLPYQLLCMRSLQSEIGSDIPVDCKSKAGDFMIFNYQVNILRDTDPRINGNIGISASDFTLFNSDGDSISCGLFHAETMAFGNQMRMSIGFDTAGFFNGANSFNLSLDNKNLKIGDVRFKFDSETITESPAITFNN